MMDIFRDAVEFHLAAVGPLPTAAPGFQVTDAMAQLKERLLTEEFDELLNAIWDNDIVGIADGCVDLVYIVGGILVAYGIDFPPAWAAVHEANMKKTGPGSSRRADGKLCKPEGWKHPDIKAIVSSQRPLSEIYSKEQEHAGSRS